MGVGSEGERKEISGREGTVGRVKERKEGNEGNIEGTKVRMIYRYFM